jgi:hypothetical protein
MSAKPHPRAHAPKTKPLRKDMREFINPGAPLAPATQGFALPRIKLPEPFGPGSIALLPSGGQTCCRPLGIGPKSGIRFWENPMPKQKTGAALAPLQSFTG